MKFGSLLIVNLPLYLSSYLAPPTIDYQTQFNAMASQIQNQIQNGFNQQFNTLNRAYVPNGNNGGLKVDYSNSKTDNNGGYSNTVVYSSGNIQPDVQVYDDGNGGKSVVATYHS
ncbi:hypothetical protein K502DRAFT_325148 [Neoconidiobolus thromboides FSU 785]|nr:hypothetical protein K502DRAFT_325148 [Neoconidiobolus thromboides FSU 785]